MVRKFAILYLISLFFFSWGLAAARYEIFPWNIIQSTYVEVHNFLYFSEGDDRGLRDRLILDHQERRSFFDYQGFQIRDSDFKDDGYLLIAHYSKSYKQTIVTLFSLSENKVLHEWVPNLDELFELTPKTRDPNNPEMTYRCRNPLLLPDGDIITTGGAGLGSLVRLDPCGHPRWAIDRHFHHSIELDAEGRIVACIWVDSPNEPTIPRNEDGYAIVSLDGEILEERSIATIMMNDEYRTLLFGIGEYEKDRLHLNDAQPIHQDNGLAKAGDIALSMRNISTVGLYRPSTRKMLWTKTGPWLNQHDINILEDGRYSVFGNDAIRNSTFETWNSIIADSTQADIYIYNPETDEITKPYAEITRKIGLRTDTQGRCRILSNGDVFIEETNRCRMLRVSPDKVRWEYISSVTEETNGVLHWSRYLPANEVDLSWLKKIDCK